VHWMTWQAVSARPYQNRLIERCLAAAREDVREEACGQGLKLVDSSAQRRRFLWDRGCI